MQKPIEVLQQFTMSKIPLQREVYIVEVGELVDRECSNPKYRDRLTQYSVEATRLSLIHFSKDNMNLSEISGAICSDEYAVSSNAKEKILDRINLINYETALFGNFQQKIRPISNESPTLRQLLVTTNLLIRPLKMNIKAISELI